MHSWHTDRVIGAGLIAALLLKIAGDIAITIATGNSPPSDLPMNIVTGLVGYMGRSLMEKGKKNDNDTKKEGDEDDSQHN